VAGPRQAAMSVRAAAFHSGLPFREAAWASRGPPRPAVLGRASLLPAARGAALRPCPAPAPPLPAVLPAGPRGLPALRNRHASRGGRRSSRLGPGESAGTTSAPSRFVTPHGFSDAGLAPVSDVPERLRMGQARESWARSVWRARGRRDFPALSLRGALKALAICGANPPAVPTRLNRQGTSS
jgi:hypothetical protein